MSFLNIYDIKKFVEEKEKRRIRVFENIYQLCLKKIETSVLKEDDFCLFQVPEFILGYPTYNLGHCIQYCIYILKKNGFVTQYFYPNIIKISWNVKGTFNNLLENEVQGDGRLLGYDGVYGNPIEIKEKKPKKSLNLDNVALEPELENEIKLNFKKEKENMSEKKFKLIDKFKPPISVFKNFNN
jgi:hypothetical protein